MHKPVVPKSIQQFKFKGYGGGKEGEKEEEEKKSKINVRYPLLLRFIHLFSSSPSCSLLVLIISTGEK